MIVKQFRGEGLPLDLVVIDSDSSTKMVWRGDVVKTSSRFDNAPR